MDRYRCTALRELKDQQVRFAPLDKRLEQIARAESLLSEIEAERHYPYEYVCFRVTGYRPEGQSGLVLEGADLQHDLGTFIEDVSASTRIEATAASEPVWTVEELSRSLKVSSKTIARWRDRGLVSRRFMVGGRMRLGFLKSSVDRFVAQNGQQVERGTRFSQLDEAEMEQIVQRARRMVQFCGPRPTEIIKRIARKLNRSAETIRYTLHSYDSENPSKAVFGRTTGPLREPAKRAIYDAQRGGQSVEELAEQYGRTRSSIYRIINEVRAQDILLDKLDYIPNPLFEQPDAGEMILAALPDAHDGEPGDGAGGSTAKAPKDLPTYLGSLYEIPLLTKEQEVHLFRKMNFLKHRAHQLREQLDPRRARSSDLDEIERLQKEAVAVKNLIIRANLRLVVSIAKRHLGSTNSFDELVSDGNMSLMRAVEKFDYARGNKFSTYASWAIMKNFARSIPEEHHKRDRFVTGHEEMFETAADPRSDEHAYENQVQQMRSSIAKILDKLDDRERYIIVSRFGLGKGGEPHTLEQVGHHLGVTKERARQIQQRAFGKLREAASEAHIELPDD